MSFLSFHHLPRVVKDDSVWEAYTTRMKPLRLRSLKEDPKSFVSRYEAEVKEPLEFWVGRLKDTKAWSIVMIHSAEDLSDAGDILLRDDVKWVGFLVMIDRREVDGEVVSTQFSPGSRIALISARAEIPQSHNARQRQRSRTGTWRHFGSVQSIVAMETANAWWNMVCRSPEMLIEQIMSKADRV